VSILKNAFKAESTGTVKPIICKLKSVEFNDDNNYKFDGFGVRRQYMLTAKIATEFWANDAEKEKAELAAMKVLNHGIYKDIHRITAMMRSACYDDDREAMFKLIDDIEREIGL